jgi:hypothetical protein
MVCGLQYTIGDCYGRDRDHMMLISEPVRDAFTACVFHDDTNSTAVGGGMGEVPCFGGMITPCFALAGFLMHKDLHAEQCQRLGIKQEGPFQCLVHNTRGLRQHGGIMLSMASLCVLSWHQWARGNNGGSPARPTVKWFFYARTVRLAGLVW